MSDSVAAAGDSPHVLDKLARPPCIHCRRQLQQPGLLVFRETQRPDERMQLLPHDSVPTRQSFELLVRLRTAVFAHDGLHSFRQYLPAGVEVSGESLTVHGYLSQAMQQSVERYDRIAKR